MDHKNELLHFNPNHDPKSGQFTSGKGGSKVASRPTGDAKYQNPDGTITSKGKRRVKKTMAQYTKMVSTEDKSERKREEKKFNKMSNKLTDAEIKELINKVSADKAIRDMYPKEQTQQNQKNQGGSNKFQMTPKEAADITKTMIDAFGTLGAMAAKRETRRLDTEIKQEKLKQEIESTKQSELLTLKKQSELVKESRAFNKKQTQKVNNTMKTEVSNVPETTVSAGKESVSLIQTYTMADLAKYTGKW